MSAKSGYLKSPQLPFSLYVKSKLVGTALGEIGLKVRWYLGAVHRHRHPELWQLFLEEKQLPHVLQRLLKVDANSADVGSHLGSFLSMLLKYAPDGKHVAFEPSKSKSEWLKRRFPTAEILSCAVADKTGVGLFEEDTVRPGYSRLSVTTAPGDANSTYEVKVCRLDDIFSKRKVDLIKIDVEGGELAALRGAVTTLNAWRPAIIFECGPEFSLERIGVDRRQIFDFLTSEMDYEIYNYSDFLFDKGPMEYSEFKKCGIYPFRALNFIAVSTPPPYCSTAGVSSHELDYRGVIKSPKGSPAN